MEITLNYGNLPVMTDMFPSCYYDRFNYIILYIIFPVNEFTRRKWVSGTVTE